MKKHCGIDSTSHVCAVPSGLEGQWRCPVCRGTWHRCAPVIQGTKNYMTRNGLPVRIYSTDGAAPHSLHGAIYLDGGWQPASWAADGVVSIFGPMSAHDLIEVETDPLTSRHDT